MHLLPILSTLRRHRMAAALIVLEIALTCAIVCNAIFLIGERLSRMDRASGVAEDGLIHVRSSTIGTRPDDAARGEQDLVALRAIPGVKSVAAINAVPFAGSSWNNSVSTIPDDPDPQVEAGVYIGSRDLIETLGVRLIAGRDFLPEEYVGVDAVQADKVPSVILTRELAERVLPGRNPVGQPLYVWGRRPVIVVGVIERLLRADDRGWPQSAYAMILPVIAPTAISNYVLRAEPERVDEVIAAVDRALDGVDPNRLFLALRSFDEIRTSFFRQDRAMAWLLVGVSLGLLVITALGVVGLASFWVQQRTRQIGIRRALGATRGDIVRYFQAENLILATIGIALGMALAYAVNLWLMDKYAVARLPAGYLPVGAVLLWLLGQIAVLGPALRASLIPPAIATRSV